MIQLHHVTKTYQVKDVRKEILRDASFVFPDGRNVAVMGKNGAGKSTLMRLISGIELPSSGRIRRDERVSWPMGFTGGFNALMTGVENVRFVARIYGVPTDDAMEYVQDFAELGPSLRLPVGTYSTGMKARLAFGLSLAVDFDCYLIDEVISVGDARFKRKSVAALKSKLGRARVIMISHSKAQIKRYCDCGILIDSGALTYYDDLDQLIAAYDAIC